MEQQPKQDDGSLAFLNIPRDPNNRSFNCEVIKQTKLVGESIKVLDFIEDVKTRYSKDENSGRVLVLCERTLKDGTTERRKFFTASPDILYILQEIQRLKKFPRTVKVCGEGNHIWWE